jgi:hypothetical protein
MNPTPSVLLLIILHFLWSFPARGAELSIDADGILPKFDEPEWNEIEYSAIPKNTEMLVRMSSEEVTNAFWGKYSNKYDRSRTRIELREERAIVHSGAYFRRLTMFITDFRERSDHGYCGEFAAI